MIFLFNQIAELRKLLVLQKTNKLEDKEEINTFVNKYFIGSNFDGEAESTDYRIMNIMNEWKSMFSYSPGFNNGIDIIIELVDEVLTNSEIEILQIYQTDAWKTLVELRAPVETVIEKQCKKCNGIFYVMGVSGFLDGVGLVCNRCGNVFFKSFYDDTEIPNCDCGGQFTGECPYCKHRSAMTIGEKSPYWYFDNHKFIRGNGF